MSIIKLQIYHENANFKIDILYFWYIIQNKVVDKYFIQIFWVVFTVDKSVNMTSILSDWAIFFVSPILMFNHLHAVGGALII